MVRIMKKCFFDEIQNGYTGMRWHLRDYRDYEEMQRIMMWKLHKVKFISNKKKISGVNVYSNNWIITGKEFLHIVRYFYILKYFYTGFDLVNFESGKGQMVVIGEGKKFNF